VMAGVQFELVAWLFVVTLSGRPYTFRAPGCPDSTT
jgi:hypothetical protein